MNLCRTLIVATTVACATAMLEGMAVCQEKSESSPRLKDGFDINAMDRRIDPCVDFYHYACGTWIKENPVPADKAVYGRFTELADRNRAQ
jgi:putative endopeptidase